MKKSIAGVSGKFLRKCAAVLVSGILIFIIVLSLGDGNKVPNFDTLADVFGISPEYPADGDYVRFLDVGEGDAALISSNGKTALIDTGTAQAADELCDKLKSYGVKQIDLLIFSHTHTDHVGGCEELMDNFAVGCLIVPQLIDEPDGTEDVISAQKRTTVNGGEVYAAAEGMRANIGDFNLEIIGYYPDLSDENDRSLFIMLEIRGKRFLLTGDAEESAEKRLIERRTDISCDVLKVAHHGSSTSSCEAFLAKCSPREAVISCGYGNTYLHPHEKAVARLEKYNSSVYRTDIYGDIIFDIGESRYEISMRK